MPRVDVGIDFGTTNCAIGYRTQDGRVTDVGPFPSVGAWSNGEVVFGEEARRRLLSGDPTVRPLRDIKMALGSGSMQAGRWPVDPVTAASALLRFIRSRISGTIPDSDIGNAVIGTPVRVSREDRIALRQAAEKAGFEGVRFVYEPTAALIGARTPAALGEAGLALVVDWGGGTLDIAAVRIEHQSFRELAVDGDRSDLGGSRIDAELTRSLLESLPKARSRVESVPDGFFRLMEEVEDQKIEILESLEDMEEEVRILPAWLDEELWLPRQVVTDTLAEYARRARDQILGSLADAAIAASEVTQILFAGGTCKSDIVRSEIREAFPHAEILAARSPQLMTARGLATLTGLDFRLELAADFAVREADDRLAVLLQQGHQFDLDAYRMFDFRVTDVEADEAVFDFGIRRSGPGHLGMRSGEASGFQSLCQLYVPVGRSDVPGGRQVPDIVRLFVGMDRNLVVAVYGEGNRTGGSAETFLSGVPTAVRIGSLGGTP